MTTSNPFEPWLRASGLAPWMAAWQSLAQQSVRSFNEPILPGWTINIDSFNSGSPQAERDILRTDSYGRQLGKLGDAVAALIARVPEQERAAPAFAELLAMKAHIDKVKARALRTG